jgi:hypothetical protein
MTIYTTDPVQSLYCVYLTIYRGNKLPPFYIGSTSISKINSGYKGSVASKEYKTIWKQELEENPSLFKTIIISKHETRSAAFDHEEYLQKARKVVPNTMYVNLSYANTRFSKHQSGKDNHMFGRIGKLHHRYGLGHSEKTKKLIADKHHDVSGANNPRAKLIYLHTPTGEIIHCYGNLKLTCNELGISFATVFKTLGTKIPVVRGRTKGYIATYGD